MKKCATAIILFSLLILGACVGNGTTSTSRDTTAGDTIEFITIDTVATFAMDTFDKASPRFEAKISLPFARGGSAVNDSINTSIIYTIFGLDSSSPQAAIDTVLTNACNEYLTLRPIYLNEKNMQQSMPQLNHELSIKGTYAIGLDNCLNYTATTYEFSGGAHGITNVALMNFDPHNGSEIMLNDFFVPNFEEPLTLALIQALGRRIGAETPEQINKKGYFNIEETLCPTENFQLARDSIIFLYNPYEIAPYSTGITRIALGYNQIQDIIQKR